VLTEIFQKTEASVHVLGRAGGPRRRRSQTRVVPDIEHQKQGQGVVPSGGGPREKNETSGRGGEAKGEGVGDRKTAVFRVKGSLEPTSKAKVLWGRGVKNGVAPRHGRGGGVYKLGLRILFIPGVGKGREPEHPGLMEHFFLNF